jgi:hypothetical protein
MERETHSLILICLLTYWFSKPLILFESPNYEIFLFRGSASCCVYFIKVIGRTDRLCGLVVRVPGYRSGGPGSIPGTTRKKKVLGLERGPLSLVSTTDELLDRKVAAV